MESLKKINMEITFDPAIPLLGMFLKELRTAYLHLATQFTAHEWIKKIWYVYIELEYYSIKKNESISFTRDWLELETIVLSHIGQSQKVNTFFLLYEKQKVHKPTDEQLK